MESDMANKMTRDFFKDLDEQELTTLQTASLLGERFRLDHLLELTPFKPSKILNIIRRMVRQNLIKEKSGIAEGIYSFAKRESRDIILESIEIRKKELLISQIAHYFEKELPDDDQKALILVDLYLSCDKEGTNYFPYMKKAADLLISAHKTQDALFLYEQMMNSLIATDNAESLETILFIDTVISYAPIAVNLRPPEVILPFIMKAKHAAELLKNNKALAMLELCLGRLYLSQGDSAKASAHYNEGWNSAQNTGDGPLIRKTSKLAALTLFWQGKMTDAIKMYERTLGDREEILPDLQDIWAHLMLAYCYGITGRIARGVGLAKAIRESVISKGSLKGEAFADAVIAQILLEVRHLEEAKTHVNSALRIGEQIGHDFVLWMAKPCKAYEAYTKGDLKTARSFMESALNHAEALGQAHYPSPWIIEILWSFDNAHVEPIKGYSFQSEVARLITWPDIYMKGAALRYHALDKKSSGLAGDEIIELLRQSQDLLTEAGACVELGRTNIELIKLLVENNEKDEAEDLAKKTYLTLTNIDPSLFPSELLCLIPDRPSENRIFNGLHAISKLSVTIDFQQSHSSYLGTIATLLTDMFGAERSAILLTQKQELHDPLNIAATRNFSTEDVVALLNSSMRAVMKAAVEKKETVVIADIVNDHTLVREIETGLGIKSVACTPLVVTGTVIGMLYADNRLLKGIFSKDDILIMNAVASQVALFLKASTLSRELDDFRNVFNEDASCAGQSELQSWFPQIVGSSTTIRNALSRAKKVSGTDATVLILGETGVGKELIARAIHQNSDRAKRPFISVNVSALTESLLTNELFGHEKGAFTGAEKVRIGRFEMADRGTIFLDEIGDLSLEAQVKLLRVLQEGEFERVGGTQLIRSDFRLIAATNRNLVEMIAKGDFRSDLFYRINIYPIEIPPLRGREGDIEELVLYFVKRYSRMHRKTVKRVPESEMKKLVAYSWPGNIRELEHTVERAVILSEKGNLSFADIGQTHLVVPGEQEATPTELLPLDEIERRHIAAVLHHAKWRIRGKQGAAEILGLKPTTLEFRMKKLGIRK